MVEAVDAEEVQTAVYTATLTILTAIAVSYGVFGCVRDWVVVGGVLVDALGAALLAAPSLPRFREYSYAGTLQDAYDAEFLDPSTHHVPPTADWYSAFLREMSDVFGDRAVSGSSEFYIEETADGYVLSHRSRAGAGADSVPLSVAGRHLRESIRTQRRRIRVTGAIVLALGFTLQFLGYVFDGMFGGVLC